MFVILSHSFHFRFNPNAIDNDDDDDDDVVVLSAVLDFPPCISIKNPVPPPPPPPSM